MSDQGKANYEGYHAAEPGSSPVPFEELPHLSRLKWDAGACSVELWLAEAPVDEDAPGSEPPKVIVVVEAPVGDRAPLERRHLAVALTALREIGRTVLEAHDERRVVVGIARDALEQIEDDL